MEIVLLAIRSLLAVVFGVAGVAKLVDRDGSRKAMIDFGVPVPVAGIAAVILPMVEIAIAFALLFVGTSWPGAIACSLLLAVFCAGMVYQLARGNAPDCHCFGQLHSEPVSVLSLCRNLALFAAAVWLVIRGPKAQGLDLANVDSSVLIAAFGAAIICLLIAILLRQSQHSTTQSAIMRRIEMVELMAGEGAAVDRQHAGNPNDGLPIGAFVPDMLLEDSEGNTVSTRSVASAGTPAIMFFVSPTCTPCKALVPRMNEWAAEFSGRLSTVFISSGSVAENSASFGDHDGNMLLRQKGREFADSMNARWTPSAVFVDRNGRIASHVAAGDTAIAGLVESVRNLDLNSEHLHIHDAERAHGSNPVEIGAKLPVFTVTAIDGREIASSRISRPTLIAFWSPTCPHCGNMAEEFRKWDEQRGPDDPDLLVFADGEAELIRSLGMTSPVILDKDYAIAEKLGMHGTPSAILVDERGRFASEIAIGAPNIWALLDNKD
ncbi:MAG: redoxin domain-containing protein [Pyrinomonadaceae bacterium]|nr:redoxin domain-containing protein [Pyrinomonadaceae bacterium]